MNRIDWDAVSACANIAIAGSAMLAGWAAVSASRAWKKELKGKDDYELSKEVYRKVRYLRTLASRSAKVKPNTFGESDWQRDVGECIRDISQLSVDCEILWHAEYLPIAETFLGYITVEVLGDGELKPKEFQEKMESPECKKVFFNMLVYLRKHIQ